MFFFLNGKSTTHIVREYAPRGNPRDFFFDANSSNLTAWAGLCGNGVIVGPYFFEGNVNGIANLTMLNEKIIPTLIQEFGKQSAYDMYQRLVVGAGMEY